MTHIRLQYEKAVLGACLSDNAYPRIAHILEPAHFKAYYSKDLSITHNRIFSTLVSMPPEVPIDLLTVSDAYSDRYGDNLNLDAYLVSLAIAASSTSNSTFYALSLFEMDLKDKFFAQLLELRDDNAKVGNRVSVELISEVITVARDKCDIFKLIENSIIFFQGHKMIHEQEVTKHFQGEMYGNICRIKQVNQIDTMAKKLVQVTGIGSHQTRRPLTKLTMALIDLAITGKLSTPSINLYD